MTVKISGKIVQFKVKGAEPASAEPAPVVAAKAAERPLVLYGTTYKLKSGFVEHAMYITINDIEVGGKKRPFEIFINTKDSSHYQWMVALTRLMSAIFRKGGEVEFLVEELGSIFDPRGGMFDKGKFYASVLAQLGEIVETHLKNLGLVGDNGPSPEVQALIEQKKKEAAASGVLANAKICSKCNDKSLVMLDGCETCVSCGYSKCG